jgi:bacteriorhodopsin
MVALIYPRNDALRTHPPTGDQYLTTNGSNWLFAVAALFGFSALALYALKFRARAGERFFHYLFIIAFLTGLIAYYAMASDLAWDPVRQVNQVARSGLIRQIFWAKYVFWIVEFSAIIIALGVLSGISWATIFFNVALSWVWIIGYLVAAYTTSNYKWGFFAFGLLAHVFLLLSTMQTGLKSATRVGIKGDYFALAGYVNFLWLLYPIAWGLSDGGNRIGVVPSFIWFGILDLLLLCGVAYGIVFLSRRWDYNRLNIAFTQYGRVPHHSGTFPEKHTGAAAPAATTAPAV